jgi:hypothetical protein
MENSLESDSISIEGVDTYHTVGLQRPHVSAKASKSRMREIYGRSEQDSCSRRRGRERRLGTPCAAQAREQLSRLEVGLPTVVRYASWHIFGIFYMSREASSVSRQPSSRSDNRAFLRTQYSAGKTDHHSCRLKVLSRLCIRGPTLFSLNVSKQIALHFALFPPQGQEVLCSYLSLWPSKGESATRTV